MDFLFTILSSFFVTLLAIKVINPVAIEVGLVDKPNERKKHAGEIPLVGGIAIFISVLASSLFFLPDTLELRMYLIASAMMVFIGALDDKYDISVRIRLVGQIIIASLMIYGVGGYISNLGNIFGFGNVNLNVGGILFTYFAIIVVINAFNMIDGIDGLVGCLSLNTYGSMAILFLFSGHYQYLSFPLMIAAATLPYLIYNLNLLPKASTKIFMGDAGSMFIGLSVIWLLTMGTQEEAASFRPVAALWICAIPLMDMLAIVIRRWRKGKSPFKPDRDHLHHILQKIGFTQKATLAIILLISIFMSFIGIAGELLKISESLMLMLFLCFFVIYTYTLRNLSKL